MAWIIVENTLSRVRIFLFVNRVRGCWWGAGGGCCCTEHHYGDAVVPGGGGSTIAVLRGRRASVRPFYGTGPRAPRPQFVLRPVQKSIINSGRI